MNTINENLKALLDERFPQSTDLLFDGASFKDAGMDSMAVVEFIVELERQFGTPTLKGNELGAESTLEGARELLKSVGVS
ncbi:acyl carrier protein [Streptomyces sp. ISL-99]|uniref:acyl carrier protein n=1 Tax=Streptomyces sp. ISL-99 TaxID=2819193 RepID=UPI001BEC81C7|nr:acyl carrier protein [Streptomyces sp. ISL-99]MBT2525715.1 acyl carrier protein [Streptomyces sp. ISL-99]